MLDLGEHHVEGGPEPADLGGRVVVLHPQRQVAGGDLAGGVLDALERAEPDADHRVAEGDEHGEHRGRNRPLDQHELAERPLEPAQRDGEKGDPR